MTFDWDAIRNTAEKKAAAETEKETSSERTYFRWSKEQTDKLVALVDKQKTAEEISRELGVPLDKVRNKLAMLKAKTPSVPMDKVNWREATRHEPQRAVRGQPPKAALGPSVEGPLEDKVRLRSSREGPLEDKPAEIVPQAAATEPQAATATAPETPDTRLFDRVVYYALDECVLRLQADGIDPALYFRRIIALLDLWVEGLRAQIVRTGEEGVAHWSAIGAIIAYKEIAEKENTDEVCEDQ